MTNTFRDSIKAADRHKKQKICGISILLLLSIIVTLNVFWSLRKTGLALAGTASCGIEEHTHTDKCVGEKKLICTLSEPIAETTAETTSEISVTPHVHTDSCYEVVYICGKTEHTHSLECYSDASADVETQLDWQNMLAGYVTGDIRNDLVAVAKSQLGYTESTRNYQLNADGSRNGYTRYGAWYGAPYSDWSAMFVSFCLNYAGLPESETPYNIGANTMAELWKAGGRYSDRSYSPEAGDIVFFSNNTVGIVSSVYFDVLQVISGDVDNSVCEQTVMTYDDIIVGYGILKLRETETSMIAETPTEVGTSMETEASTTPEASTTTEVPTVSEAPMVSETPAIIVPTLGSAPTIGFMQFNTLESTASDTLELKNCDCGSTAEDISSHADTCARKSQLTGLAADKTAEELYALWSQLKTDEQNYILTYLYNNQWQYGDKDKTLSNLIAGGSESGLTGTCGNASFTVEGSLPSTAKLEVADPQYTKERAYSFINPNIQSDIRQYWVYDISITNNGSAYVPAEAVTVTVSSSEFYVQEDEYFCVSHLNEFTGQIIGTQYVDVINNSVTFTADSFSPYMFYRISKDIDGGERILGTNWITLRDSGWFEYWQQFLPQFNTLSAGDLYQTVRTTGATPPSDQQIDNHGGETDDGTVEVSKTIAGTDVENVFDITLTVKTKESIEKIYSEPDVAVVIVMDISNTMKDNFGNTTRYKAAMEAAEAFLDKFVQKTNGATVSKVGYVAFNTDAHKIFDLSPCSNETQANALKNTMRTQTGNIINADGYGSSHAKFTNIEAGLKMGYEMLAAASNEHKYLIFLSDGFPTTYIANGTDGYCPYYHDWNACNGGCGHTNGKFMDNVKKVKCNGTSYSDTAAQKAHSMATTIKNAGVTIFSIGVDIGGQNIQAYINATSNSWSIVECGNGSYTGSSGNYTYNYNFEIGDTTTSNSYKNWLKNSIGSGYYYDSTNADDLAKAYDDIFASIISEIEEASKADWVTQDPLPTGTPDWIEFIGFYDKNGNFIPTYFDKNEGLSLSGTAAENGEDTASVSNADGQTRIKWDLKASGYTSATEGNSTTYTYELVYRVRLKNEIGNFVENQIYETNDKTTLTYRSFVTQNGVTTKSEQKTIEFKIPSVHGYLAEFSFKKIDTLGRALAGAEFALAHDPNCSVCRGDGKTAVPITTFTTESDADGNVTFKNIPSGHKYLLYETKAPPGYLQSDTKYAVTVAYDVITVEGMSNGEVVNTPIQYELPSTGGSGTMYYIIAGTAIISATVIYGFVLWRRRERRNE